jgi:predicted DNA-binding transcriptional regulator
VYVVFLFYPPATLVLVNWLQSIGWDGIHNYIVRLWLIAVPVVVALIAVLAIGAWIGWTMATTPPPRPIEEIEADDELEKDE